MIRPALATAWLCSATLAADPDPTEKYTRAVKAEDEVSRKLAERVAKPGDSEREKWFKRLDEVFTNKVPPTAADWFDLVTAGRPEWTRDSSRYFAEFHERICYRLDLKKDTVVTRDLFAAYADRFLGPDSPPWRVLDFAEESRGVFKHLDANRDGKLTREECSPGLQERFTEADTDKDGVVSPGEYRDYLTARVGYESRFAPQPEPPKGEKKEEQKGEKKVDEPEEPRPVVYHDAKSLPKDLPGWFRELDADKDFQIGLYEWVAGKRLTGDFEAMDLNNDGLLEVAEYLRYRKKLAEGGKGDLHAIAPGGKEQGKKK